MVNKDGTVTIKKYGGMRIIDGADLADNIATLSAFNADKVDEYARTHERVSWIPVEMVLEMIDAQEELKD